MKNNNRKIAVISMSGGMDSSSLLINLLALNYEVYCISFNYGQKHVIEIEKSRELVNYLQSLNRFKITHHITDLSSLSCLLESSLTNKLKSIPEGIYDLSNMKSTVVPNRNKIFSSIIQAYSLSLYSNNNCEVVMGLGIHAGDHSVYPDTTPAFIEKDYNAFIQGNWDASNVKYYTPYIELSKSDVLRDGLKSCDQLSLDYNKVYEKTFTSYIPIVINGNIYSDYKSASSLSRIEAFMHNNIKDPIQYADQDGVREWEYVTAYFKNQQPNT